MTFQEWQNKLQVIFEEMIDIFGEEAIKDWVGWIESPDQDEEQENQNTVA